MCTLRNQRDPKHKHMHTTYANGVTVFWIGNDAFFCVEEKDSFEKVRPPFTVSDLPMWVLELLEELIGRDVMLPGRLRDNITEYLEWFHTRKVAHPVVHILRKINWGVLPLIWKPIFISDVPYSVSTTDAKNAQKQLLDSILSPEEHLAHMDTALPIVQAIIIGSV